MSQEEMPDLRHVVVKSAVEVAIDLIERGSFNSVLDPYKLLDPNLTESVKQVRGYRNWIAHGKISKEPPFVEPKAAFERLSQFLTAIGAIESPPSAPCERESLH